MSAPPQASPSLQIGLVLFPDGPHRQRFRVVLVPLPVPVLSQVILVVQQQFFQAGPRHVHQAQLGLAGRGGGAAAFGDVLSPAARRLHHLIVRARTLAHETVAETHRAVVHQRRHLKGAQLPVTTTRSQAALPITVAWAGGST